MGIVRVLRHKDAFFVKTEIHACLPDSVISRTLGHAPCMPPGPAIPNRRPFHALHALFRSAGASLENAVITGANFNGADLTGVNFEDALVGNRRWNNVRARLCLRPHSSWPQWAHWVVNSSFKLISSG